MRPIYIFDSEVYRNYYLASFLDIATGEVHHFEMYPEQTYDENGVFEIPIPGVKLDTKAIFRILRTGTIVTFNGLNYDMPILSAALYGSNNADIKKISDKIILNNVKYWHLNIELVECDHIDIFNVAPGTASLKIYGGRIHCPKMQDLPIDPAAEIDAGQRAELRQYCENDLATTRTLYETLKPQIELRSQMGKMYNLELRSKSDAQIAEAVIRKEVEKLVNRKLDKPLPKVIRFRYAPPKWIKFNSQVLRDALATVTSAEFATLDNGTLRMPDKIAKLDIPINGGVYRMGIGGLHSSEKGVAHHSDEEHVIVDRDVTSYYPSIILNCNLYPGNMGHGFLSIYRDLVNQRLQAKKKGDNITADALKITINGSFGKFGSPYSFLYSPSLLIQTTVTGQLALLMLIEQFESEGIRVISANTDGVTVKCPRNKITLADIVAMEWQANTGFGLEETEYKALYSRDVNNYVAIKAAGGFKAKGAYATAGLMKNPTNEICSGAVIKFLLDGTPVEQSIRSCRDVRKFVTIRQVKGGAVRGDDYLGKAVRWYYSIAGVGTINYKVNGYTVPRTEGAIPLMELPDELPADVDYDWYINEARSILSDIGFAQSQRVV